MAESNNLAYYGATSAQSKFKFIPPVTAPLHSYQPALGQPQQQQHVQLIPQLHYELQKSLYKSTSNNSINESNESSDSLNESIGSSENSDSSVKSDFIQHDDAAGVAAQINPSAS